MRVQLVRQAARLPQWQRFLIGGGSAAAVNWIVRFPLSNIMPFVAAVIAATVIGMGVGFVTYQTFVFPGSTRPLRLRLRDFLLVNAGATLGVAGSAAIALVLLGGVMAHGAAEAIAHAVGIAVGAVLNFTGHRLLTFRDAAVAPPSGYV